VWRDRGIDVQIPPTPNINIWTSFRLHMRGGKHLLGSLENANLNHSSNQASQYKSSIQLYLHLAVWLFDFVNFSCMLVAM
jgi:hypothetical protein